METATYRNIFGSLVSLIFYCVDLVTDGFVAYFYYNNGWTVYFGLSLTFIILPAIFIALCSIILYKADKKKVPKSAYLSIFIPFLAPIIRYVNSIYYGFKSKSAESPAVADKYYRKMMEENDDLGVLKVCEGFMELAPQVILQAFVLFYYSQNEGPLKNATGARLMVAITSVVISCVLLALTVTSFNTRVRSDSKATSSCAYFVQLLWQLGSLSSRLATLAILFVLFPNIGAVAVPIHFIVVFIALYCFQQRDQSKTPWRQGFLYVFYAFIHIFSKFNIGEGQPSKKFNITFALLVFVQNTVILALWVFSAPIQYRRLRMIEMITIKLIALSGIIFMVIYNKCCKSPVSRTQVPSAESDEPI